MSTRSNIGIIESDGTVTFVYCHFDGYPEHNGALLLAHHNSEAAARLLVSFGEMSVLGERVNPIGPHSYEKPEEGTCIYYERDRGEKGCGVAQTASTRDGAYQQEYCYLWDPKANKKAGAWIWTGHGTAWKRLTPANCRR